ncbi:DEAD/DEAH box helicase [Kitasatospora sp. SC0581]|uniref:DEAD/DEAH box helicase n=1 Tax=Kitasatospora sp. SC0581 TaxID=3394360 RepID=UPI003A85B949
MTFYGLFVGIDRYEAEFDRLRFAKRDATVLAALFDDNLEGSSTLLLDGDATKGKFVTEVRRLAEVSTGEDVVVIAFSGHGIAGGALATYDTMPERMAETSLSLDELADLTRGIRAGTLLLVLDCCFSGHAVDKVLRVPQGGYTSREVSTSVTDRLNGLREAGWAVIAASGRDQQAFEEQVLRHGLLTHYLIQGLLGHSDAVDDGKVYLIKLIHYVFKNVGAHGRSKPERAQDPVLGGNISNISLEIFKRGPNYLATVDGVRPQPATAELSSLAEHKIPHSVLEAWQGRIRKLNKVQLEAINAGALLEGMNVLVSAPTSTGKTMVGELAAMRAVAEGKKAVFLLPTRALVYEQYERFRSLYEPLGFITVRATGELRDQMADLVTRKFDLAVLTYEKFIGLMSRRPDLLGVGVLVIDEIQSLMQSDRGPLLETLLTRLRLRADSAGTPQIVGLSAVLGQPEQLARWLGANLVEVDRRSVPLLEGVLGPDGCYRYRDHQGHEASEQLLEPENANEPGGEERLVVRLVERLVAEGQQVIVFRGTRGEARRLAESLARTLGLPAAESTRAALSDEDGGRATDLLRGCLEGGVAFHVSDLTLEERGLLEGSFRRPGSELRVLVATTTLAQGVNLPADVVVICELEHPEGRGPYSVAEYKNMAGRAGRSGLVKRGRAVIRARGAADADRRWQRYVQAEPEEVRSALSEPTTDVRAVILAALAGPAVLAHNGSGSEIERFLAATFAAHLCRATGSAGPFPPEVVRSAVDRLISDGFLARVSNGSTVLPGGLVLTDLGKITVRSGLGVDSVTAVAAALQAVPGDRINGSTLVCAAQLASELDDPRFVQHSQRLREEHVRLAGRLGARTVAEPVLARLMGTMSRNDVGAGIGRARRGLACVMWIEGIKIANIENEIRRWSRATGQLLPGPVQHAVRRTADVIATVVDIAYHLHPDADLAGLADVLPAQLELGIVAGLVPIAWKAEAPLGRPVYLALARAGLTSPGAVVAAGHDHLLACVGGDLEQHRVVRAAAVAAQEEIDGLDPGDQASPSGD